MFMIDIEAYFEITERHGTTCSFSHKYDLIGLYAYPRSTSLTIAYTVGLSHGNHLPGAT